MKKFGVLTGASLSQLVQLSADCDPDELRNKCEDLMAKLLPGRNVHDYQVGLTRVYFREGILEKLETMRAQALRKYAILLQKTVRGFVVRRRFLRQRKLVVIIQKQWRRHVLREPIPYVATRRDSLASPCPRLPGTNGFPDHEVRPLHHSLPSHLQSILGETAICEADLGQ
ncbi:hypothetical protein PINS_up015318 [Pythium insidiosum]|nr:hypothetical protein PINS_up015318 [Pythium insidiosum]